MFKETVVNECENCRKPVLVKLYGGRGKKGFWWDCNACGLSSRTRIYSTKEVKIG